MHRFVVLFAVFALTAARAPIPTIEIESNNIDLSAEDDAFLPLLQLNNSSSAANEVTNVFLFSQLTAVPSKGKVEGTIRYTLGKRVQNDRMVGYSGDTKYWPAPQDVTLNLRYPTAGQGATVTYVEIIVGQSSNLGEAKVIAGGIAQRSIAIVVTARSTSWLNYVAYFYGI